MVNLIPTIIFETLLVLAATALFGATVRSMLPRGGVAFGRFLPIAGGRSGRAVRRGSRAARGRGRVVPLAARRRELARRAS